MPTLNELLLPDDPLSPEVQRRIDRLCDAFEAAFRRGEQPAIEDYWERVEPVAQPRLLGDLVQLEMALKSGSAPSLDMAGYRQRFPQHTEVLEELRDWVSRNGETRSISNDQSPQDLLCAAVDEELPPGTCVGRYRILSCVGQGSFGRVYRARDSELERDVALKLPRYTTNDPEKHEQFRREARILAGMEHPHILRVYDAGEADGRYYVASELIAGTTLECRLREVPTHRLAPREAARLVAEIAAGLDHAHRRSLVHRDVKPGNILLAADGRAVLADFGIALIPDDFSFVEQFVGTPHYMSPEQVCGDAGKLDGRSDIYSLGVVLYEALTGRLPYRSRKLDDLWREITEAELPPPRQVEPSIPPELQAICLKCLAKQADQRYATSADLAQALNAWLRDDARPRRWNRRNAVLMLGGAAGLAVLAAWAVRPPKDHADAGSAVASSVSPSEMPTAVRLQRAELHVQRDPTASDFESQLLVHSGQEQLLDDVPALDADHRFVLLYHFDRPTPWYLVHVDPEGGSAVVAYSTEPTAEVRVPELIGRGVAFRADDPKGVNLLLLLGGNLPAAMSASELAAQIADAQGQLASLPPRWSQLRAGMQQHQCAIQLPEDCLRDIQQRLPDGLHPLHALFLQTRQ